MEPLDIAAFGIVNRPRDLKPLPSTQPYCPKKAEYARLDPDTDPSDIVNTLYFSMGNAIHAAMQEAYSATHRVLGDWKCIYCKQEWKRCEKPQHEHANRVKYVEIRVGIPGHDRETAADLIYVPEGLEDWCLIEMKSSNTMPLRPHRTHWLQANLTAFSVGLKHFRLLYIDRYNPRNSVVSEIYPVEPETAAVQIALLNGSLGCGICSKPGDWECRYKDQCFAAGQADLYPEVAYLVDRLKWQSDDLI
jgi:hypothetical protein